MTGEAKCTACSTTLRGSASKCPGCKAKLWPCVRCGTPLVVKDHLRGTVSMKTWEFCAPGTPIVRADLLEPQQSPCPTCGEPEPFTATLLGWTVGFLLAVVGFAVGLLIAFVLASLFADALLNKHRVSWFVVIGVAAVLAAVTIIVARLLEGGIRRLLPRPLRRRIGLPVPNLTVQRVNTGTVRVHPGDGVRPMRRRPSSPYEYMANVYRTYDCSKAHPEIDLAAYDYQREASGLSESADCDQLLGHAVALLRRSKLKTLDSRNRTALRVMRSRARKGTVRGSDVQAYFSELQRRWSGMYRS